MIYYLSGTGNTKWVAEKLAALLGEETADVASQTLGDDPVCEGCLLGFCFPVHGWRPPRPILEFVDSLDAQAVARRHPFVFAVCTAGDTIGEAMGMFAQHTLQRGVPLRAAYDVKMPNTYVGLPFMDVDGKALQAAKLREAERRIEDIAERIKERRKETDLQYFGRWRRINTRLLGALFTKFLVTDKRFFVDEGSCAKCGKCAAVCPVSNIQGGKGETPRWRRNKKCMTCFACYHNCPKHAIQYGWMTKGKGQYRFANAPRE